MNVLLLLVLALFSLAQASLQDIVLESSLLRGSADYSNSGADTSIISSIPSEDSVEARWHLFAGIQEALRGIYSQELEIPVDRSKGVETSLQHLETAHALEKNNNWIIFNLALIALRQGSYSLARNHLNLIHTQDTFLQDKVSMLTAYSYEFEGKINQAKKYLKIVKLGREIPYDDYEPPKYYVRQPSHSFVDYREYFSDIIVFHEMYNQYLQLIEEFGSEDEFRDTRPVDTRQGYYPINEGRQNVKEAADFFVSKHYVVLQGLINPTEIKIIGRWFHWLKDSKMQSTSETNLQRFTGHCDRITWYYHSRLLSVHSRLAQEIVKPAYTFISYYTPVQDARTPRPYLQGHTDRDDNEYTSSIQVFNIDREGNQADSWPIWVDNNQTLPAFSSWRTPPTQNAHSIDLHQMDGDAILFRGRQHIHWRENMPENTHATLTFLLHYVDDSFDFHDYKITRGGKDKQAGGKEANY